MTAESGRIAEAVRRGIPYEKIHQITKIDMWFIDKIAILVEMEQSLRAEQPRDVWTCWNLLKRSKAY
ncbi:MAG: hypothetical protein ACLUGQ_11140 [Coprococcus sp.]